MALPRMLAYLPFSSVARRLRDDGGAGSPEWNPAASGTQRTVTRTSPLPAVASGTGISLSVLSLEKETICQP